MSRSCVVLCGVGYMQVSGRFSAINRRLVSLMPWALSAGLIVSFTASAGHDPSARTLDGTAMMAKRPTLLLTVPEGGVASMRRAGFTADPSEAAALVQSARLSFTEPLNRGTVVERRPREELKSVASAFPDVDRSNKADPLVQLRPSLSHNGGSELSSLFFQHDPSGLSSQFRGWSDSAMELELATRLEPPALQDQAKIAYHKAAPEPVAESLYIEELRTTPRAAPHLLPNHQHDGSTPAAVGSSMTPAQSASQPMMVAALPVRQVAPVTISHSATASVDKTVSARTTVITKQAHQPDYAALIEPADRARQMRCLAEVIYFEARSESQTGQTAVAQVVMNRVASELYPNSVCGVVYQNRHRYLACQFTFACEGRSLRINEPEPWRIAVRISQSVIDGSTYLADVGGSTHYHANYVRPYWARSLRKMDVIGKHVFYKLKPGQT
jgi:spore germination cell wall hydrolase CwlJ-like protein